MIWYSLSFQLSLSGSCTSSCDKPWWYSSICWYNSSIWCSVCGRYGWGTISIPRFVQTFSAAAVPASQCVLSLTQSTLLLYKCCWSSVCWRSCYTSAVDLVFAEGGATVPSKHQTTAEHQTALVVLLCFPWLQRCPHSIADLYCRYAVPAVLCQGGNPAVIMARTVKYLNISDASRAAFASLQPVAFLSFHSSCCCRFSSLWSIVDSQRWYYSSYLTPTQGWGSCCFWCWSTSVSWFMSHLQCCYCSSISCSACWLHQGTGVKYRYLTLSDASRAVIALLQPVILSWICYRPPALLQFQHPIYVSVHTSIASIERCAIALASVALSSVVANKIEAY